MGVKGLWSLLNPVARPVQIESMEGKRLAIDSSIWLYQFQATMRDKDGRVLVNAHVLGFLRRINKLLFHGIKPVFVFDGGAPALKRSTIAERKRKKVGAAVNHAKTAEKLFAAQMRREAVKVAQQQREQQAAKDAASAAAAAMRYNSDSGDQIAENAVYLEDLEGRPGPSMPRPAAPATATLTSEPDAIDPAEERRRKFRKFDPYKLPETVMPTVSTAEKPDARLATEEELKQFIDEVHPEDIDIESPEFRALPTEVQYEIIGDLRVRSRQQSHRRLADMLRAAPTALDFSMAQIKHLSQRNALTQQLLTVTDMVGKAHLTIPVRIAAERNREYVLVKRGESEGGGWALGIREGSKANPIQVEDEKGSDESDTDSESGSDDERARENSQGSDIKEISPPPRPLSNSVDPDLKEFRRREILEAIVRRYTPAVPAKPSLDVPVKSFGQRRNQDSTPLFEPEDDVEDVVPTANDEALALALQQEELGSDEETADPDLAHALALSRKEAEKHSKSPSLPLLGPDDLGIFDHFEPCQLERGKAKSAQDHTEPIDTLEGTDESMDELEEVSMVPSGRSTPVLVSHEATPVDDSDEEDLEEVRSLPQSQHSASSMADPTSYTSSEQAPTITATSSVPSIIQPKPFRTAQDIPRLQLAQPIPMKAHHPPVLPRLPSGQHSLPHVPVKPSPLARCPSVEVIVPSSDGSMEEVPIPMEVGTSTPPKSLRPNDEHLPDFFPETPESRAARERQNGVDMPEVFRSPHKRSAASLLAFINPDEEEDPLNDLRPETRSVSRSVSAQEVADDDEEEDEDVDDSRSIEWSNSPSPRVRHRPPLQPAQSGETIPSEADEEDGVMNGEDMAAEKDDYARFMAQIKNRDLNEVRTEIDDEIRVLNNQNKVAVRDSDEITQSMVNQIQTLLRHFGIPYITAPMEAEAQCAKLAELGLVDGIITDDSDVFLFGGTQCFKNIFNDAKYAECFLLADINRELSLSRDRLISLAYFLGSDYTIGLPGVGPVVALEILANFPGDNGVWDFKEWWMKVQRGQDSENDMNTKWKRSFKRRYSSSIFLTNDWPNLLVREAYKYPTTDESEEPFHWGFPKLSALRSFLHEELSWSISKVDDELTPIVQRIARRGKAGSLNKQGTLDPFFDMSVTAGNYAPRRRTTANVSKRLMSVIKQFREAEAAARGEKVEGWGEMMTGLDEEDPKGRGTGKRREKAKSKAPEDGLEIMPKEDEDVKGEVRDMGKKRKRARKNTASSIATTEVSTSSEIGDSEHGENELASGTRGKVKKARGRGRGRGRGTRRWVGERWDVIERPD